MNNKKEHQLDNQAQKNRRDSIAAFSLITQLGIILFTSVAVSLLIGNFIDRHFGTSPWFVIIFSIIGVGAAFRNINILFVKKFNNKEK